MRHSDAGAFAESVGQVVDLHKEKLVEAAGIEETRTGFTKPFARREFALHTAAAVHEVDPAASCLGPSRPARNRSLVATVRQLECQPLRLLPEGHDHGPTP